jgi:hypothetical protein
MTSKRGASSMCKGHNDGCGLFRFRDDSIKNSWMRRVIKIVSMHLSVICADCEVAP